MKEHADEYHVDPDRIALIGESAGGHLASLAALNGGPSVKAVVALYSPMDLVALAKNSELIPAAIRTSCRVRPSKDCFWRRLGQLSPIEKVRSKMPPFSADSWHGRSDCPFRTIARDVQQNAIGGRGVQSVSGAGRRTRNSPLGIVAFN